MPAAAARAVQGLDREDSQDGEDNANGGANNGGGSSSSLAHAAEQSATAHFQQRRRPRAASMRVKREPSSDGARSPAACTGARHGCRLYTCSSLS